MPIAGKHDPMHYVLVLSNDLRQGADLYISVQKKRYTRITKTGLKNVKEGDILYVLAHGYHSIDGKSALNEISTIKGDMNPDVFCTFLKDNGLENVRIKLKIFSCFSAGLTHTDEDNIKLNESFAGQVASLLRGTHNRIIVYGYLDQTKFGGVNNGHKSAGTRLGDNTSFRAKDRRYEFALDGAINGPGGLPQLLEQRWH